MNSPGHDACTKGVEASLAVLDEQVDIVDQIPASLIPLKVGKERLGKHAGVDHEPSASPPRR